MKDAALILLAIVTVYTVLSWASAPAAVATERTRTEAAQGRAAILETRVARIPTPTPGRFYSGYPYYP